MAGCGGNCECKAQKEERRAETPRTSLTDSLARVIVDNKVIARTVELYELGVVRVEDLVAQINADKNAGII